MTCPKCNFQNSEGLFICQQCRAVLAVPTPPTVPTSPVIPSLVPAEPEATPNPLKKWLWVLAGVTGLILIFAVVAAIAVKSKPDSSDKAVPSATISPSPTSGFSSFTESAAPQAPKTKYDIDSDGDAIPDFVETAIGFDPNFNNAMNCIKKACGEPSESQTPAQTNILFILDASGSMAQSITGGVKMDIAKEALKKYGESVSEGTNVGLMVYGHKGSNSATDKAVSCAGIDMIYPLGKMDKTSFETSFSGFSPTGWTVIGGSLRKAQEAFAGRESEKNYVIVISDGIETCDSDPVGAAKELKGLGVNTQVDVIGLAVDAGAKTQLEEIARVGGGRYLPANTALELDAALGKAVEAALQQFLCSAIGGRDYQSCLIIENYKPASQYLNDDFMRLINSGGSKDEKDANLRAKKKLLDYWEKLYSDNLSISGKANEELYNKFMELYKKKHGL